jgi:hypothetical protein
MVMMKLKIGDFWQDEKEFELNIGDLWEVEKEFELNILLEYSEIEKKEHDQMEIPDELKKIMGFRPVLIGFDITHFLEYIESYDQELIAITDSVIGDSCFNVFFILRGSKIFDKDTFIKHIESYDPASRPKPDLFHGLSASDIEHLQSKVELPIDNPKYNYTGGCTHCSYQYATRNYTSWYDNGYYRYNDTCSCSMMMGCGGNGYVCNSWCPTTQHGYPTLYISSWTNRFTQTTYTSQCSQGDYYVYYSY